ncbi:hypothetical protein AAC387_Pa10g0810 [Persea americana]
MHPHVEIPIDEIPHQRQPPPTAKHPHMQRGHYYAHRVKESLASRVAKCLCTCFLGLLFLIGLLAFILWLSLRPHRPRFHVRSFTLAGLGQENGFLNASISFNVTVRNPNQNVDIYYDEMDGRVFYSEQQVGMTALASPSHQEPKNTTYVAGVLTGASLSITEEKWKEFVAAGTVLFRLELAPRMRFKIYMWDSHWHRMHASCDVGVGPDGQIAATYRNKKCSIYFY